jgi:hypothetical protein
MPIPGFTADASIGPTTQFYRVENRYGTDIPSGLYPQWNDGDMDVDSDGLGDEAAMEITDVEADWEEGLGDESALDITDVEADDDLESDVSI